MKYIITLPLILVALVVLGHQAPRAADSRRVIYVLDSAVPPAFMSSKFICRQARIYLPINIDEKYHAHGLNIVEIIGHKIDQDQFCIVPLKVFEADGQFLKSEYRAGLKRAINDPKTVAVNLSMSGGPPSVEEFRLLDALARRGVKVVMSAGNDGIPLLPEFCIVFPACYAVHSQSENLIVVTDPNLEVANIPFFPHATAPGYRRGHTVKASGTSQSAAEHTGSLFTKEGQ